MPPVKGLNLQDSFLNQARRDGEEVKVVLSNGDPIIGVVKAFDQFTVLVKCLGSHHLLYKHAIAQVVSSKSGINETHSDVANPATGAGEGGAPRRERGNGGDRKGRGPRGGKSPRTEAGAPTTPPAEKFNPIDLSGLRVKPAGS